jgi:hypothetical protein
MQAFLGNQLTKHVSVKMDSWKPTGYGTRLLGYESERCGYLETDSVRTRFRVNGHFPWLKLDYKSGPAEKNGFIRK